MKTILVAVLCLAMLGAQGLPAQPTGSSQAMPATNNLQERVLKLEIEHSETIKSLTASNEQFRSLLNVVGALIAVLVGLQGIFSFRQIWREHKRDETAHEVHTRNLGGMDKVNEIMSVMQQTFKSRLDAEEDEREKAGAAQKKVEAIEGKFGKLEEFLQKYQATIQRDRERIEHQALQTAKVSRHDFRKMPNQLKSFAHDLDKFKAESEPMETLPARFTARVPYIRGIAAHYDNQPEKAKECLDEVVSASVKEDKEDGTAFDRRCANAYYYLGVIESNFGRYNEALIKFKKANELDPLQKDFLTRIVIAEACLMDNDLPGAEEYLKAVEEAVDSERNLPIKPPNFIQHLRLYHRATLLRANMAIISRPAAWRKDAEEYLNKVHVAEPLYYFATATLGQIAQHHGEAAQAQQLLKEAYESIKDSGDLATVTEARSLILLLLLAGICSKHGTMDLGRANDYFAKAEGLCPTLPRLGSDVCTVFSPLSKRNEPVHEIESHIDALRNGKVLL